MKAFTRALLISCAALVVLGLMPAASQAAFGIHGFDVTFEEEDGSAATAAGSHPFVTETAFHLNFTETAPLTFIPDGEIKDLEVNLPVGFAGDPTATPRCTQAQFALRNPVTETPSCPDSTAVGVVFPEANNPGPAPEAPVYNLDPPAGVVAELGFYASDIIPVVLELSLSETKPYHVIARTVNTAQPVNVYGAEVRIWGNPESPVHDGERGNCAVPNGPFDGKLCPNEGAAEKPFVTLPRACPDSPLSASYSAISWQEPGAAPVTGSSASSLTPTACQGLGFGPTIEAEPTVTSAETPTGLDVDLDVDDPGLTEVTGTADSDIKKTVVTLPEGVTTNSAVANGLAGCTQAQFGSETLASTPGTGCPEASKIGSVEVETPLLENTVLPGSIYVAKQGDNEFGNLLTIDMVIKDPKLGILVRAAGRVDPDPGSGRLTTTFDELPQLPFSHFRLHFRDGERAPLLTPPTCGTFATTAELYPYARPTEPLAQTATFEIGAGAKGGGCVASAAQLPNTPGFSAGTTDPTAGSYSPFVLGLSRADGTQRFSQIKTTLPPGLLGKLAGIPYCPEAGISQAGSRAGEGQGAVEQRDPSCPASSEVGKVVVGAGAGDQPLYVSGTAYLAGPYKGAPLSLEIITPAIAGPFDLGVVAVRTALQVNPVTAQISAESDPIPTILHGLSLDVRSISLSMDRPSFTLNPTSCEPKEIIGEAISPLSSVVPLDQYFQAQNCAALKFRPKLTLALKGATRRAGHPALKATLTYPKSGAYANVARAQVGLPHSEFLDNGSINTVCTQPNLKAGTCPKKSIYGRAKAWSPLLDKPLEGPVYLGVGYGHKLPDLVADLDGQVRVLLNGRVSTTRQHGLKNTFEAVPDAPVSKFVLELKGGPKFGLIENSENLCLKAQKAAASFVAQNGLRLQSSVPIANGCGAKDKSSGHSGKHRKSNKRTGR